MKLTLFILVIFILTSCKTIKKSEQPKTSINTQAVTVSNENVSEVKRKMIDKIEKKGRVFDQSLLTLLANLPKNKVKKVESTFSNIKKINKGLIKIIESMNDEEVLGLNRIDQYAREQPKDPNFMSTISSGKKVYTGSEVQQAMKFDAETTNTFSLLKQMFVNSKIADDKKATHLASQVVTKNYKVLAEKQRADILEMSSKPRIKNYLSLANEYAKELPKLFLIIKE